MELDGSSSAVYVPTLMASCFLGRELSERGLRIGSSCLRLADLAAIGIAEVKEPTATDPMVELPNLAVFLGFFLTPVMLLRLT